MHLYYIYIYIYDYWEFYVLYPVDESRIAKEEADGIINSLSALSFSLLYLILIFLPVILIFGFLADFLHKIFSFSKGKLTLENGDEFEGQLRKGKMDGKGIYTFENGEIYKGRFRNNKFHGRGKYFYPDGTIKTGKWKNDEYLKSRFL